MNSHQYVLVYGDLVQGFMFTGPYATREDAERAKGDADATIARLWAPAKQMPYDAD